MPEHGVFHHIGRAMFEGGGITLFELDTADTVQRTGDPLQRVDFHHRQPAQVPRGIVTRVILAQLLPFLDAQRLLIGLTQTLKALWVFIRARLFEQDCVLAFDIACIGIRREAKGGPATHCVCNSMKTWDASTSGNLILRTLPVSRRKVLGSYRQSPTNVYCSPA